MSPFKHTIRRFMPALLGLVATIALIHASFAEAEDEEFRTNGTMREETSRLVGLMETMHYSREPITEIDSNEFIKTYMSDLDFQRIFFLDQDLKEFQRRFGATMDIYMHQGSLRPAFEIFNTYRERAQARVDWVFERLDQPFTFDADETYLTDRSEADWPTTQEEADALWERRLKYELLNEALGSSDNATTEALKEIDLETYNENEEDTSTEDEPAFEERLAEAIETIRQRYERLETTLEQFETQEVQETFLSSLAHMYDPHSTFFSADSLEDFTISMQNSLVGIGAVLSMEDGYCTIRELIPGGPADKSGLLGPDDKIVGVAQGEGEMVDVIGMKLRKIVKMIRGKDGTIVRLLIQPAESDPSERKIIPLRRDEVELTAKLAKASLFDIPNDQGGEYKIGVIDLPAFYGSSDRKSSTTADVEELINKLKAQGMEGLVLDLRRNGGGLLSEAVDLAGLFIPEGPVVQVRDTLGRVDERLDRDPKVAWDGPLIVLISRFSASASEIVTGALTNHRRALVVGDRTTHGKGTVQAVFEMDRDSTFLRPSRPTRGAAKITIQKWYLPDGNSTQIKGVESDIRLPSLNEFLPIGEDDQPNAMKWDSIAPLGWFDRHDISELAPQLNSVLIDQELIEELRKASEERQKVLPEFDYLNTRIDWFGEKQEEKEISLNLKKRREMRKQDEVFRDEMQARLDELAKLNFDFEEVLLDVTLEKEEESRLAHEEQDKAEHEGSESETTDNEVAKEDEPSLDIHLREALRIMTDWLEMHKEPKTEVAAKTSKSEE